MMFWVQKVKDWRLFLWLPFAFLLLRAVVYNVLHAIDIEAVCYRVEPGSSETVCGTGGYASPYLDAFDFLIFACYPPAVCVAYARIVQGWGALSKTATALNILGFTLSSLTVALLVEAMHYNSGLDLP